MKIKMKKPFGIILTLLLITALLSGCGKTKITLLPEDADLTYGPNIVLEPDKKPYNLGNFTFDDEVSWDVEIEESGAYYFAIEYSRPGQFPTTWGVVAVHTEDGIKELNFRAEPTGKDKEGEEHDWSVYEKRDHIGLRLEPGPITIVLYESDKENEVERSEMPDYFINLRSITITNTNDSN